MKRIAILFLLFVGTIYSQTYYMNVWTKDGKVTSIPIQDIRKFTFNGGASAVGNSNSTAVIKTFTLFQNYPNPFNPSTTIQYQIPKNGNVEIKIFSVDGKLVKTIHNTNQVSGSYTISWNGKNDAGQNVASGLYIYQVAFDNSMLAKKMLLLK